MGKGASFAVDAADRGAHARCFDVQIKAGALQQVGAGDLSFAETNTARHDATVAVYDHERRLVRRLTKRAGVDQR